VATNCIGAAGISRDGERFGLRAFGQVELSSHQVHVSQVVERKGEPPAVAARAGE
jgi:hypothetical protein